jgi:hypothetical protein
MKQSPPRNTGDWIKKEWEQAITVVIACFCLLIALITGKAILSILIHNPPRTEAPNPKVPPFAAEAMAFLSVDERSRIKLRPDHAFLLKPGDWRPPTVEDVPIDDRPLPPVDVSMDDLLRQVRGGIPRTLAGIRIMKPEEPPPVEPPPDAPPPDAPPADTIVYHGWGTVKGRRVALIRYDDNVNSRSRSFYLPKGALIRDVIQVDQFDKDSLMLRDKSTGEIITLHHGDMLALPIDE